MLFALFCAGATARASARAAGVNRNTAARIFRVFRLLIALSRLSLAPFSGRVEIDECYLRGGYRHNLRLFLAEIEMRFECGVKTFEKAFRKLLRNCNRAKTFDSFRAVG